MVITILHNNVRYTGNVWKNKYDGYIKEITTNQQSVTTVPKNIRPT